MGAPVKVSSKALPEGDDYPYSLVLLGPALSLFSSSSTSVSNSLSLSTHNLIHSIVSSFGFLVRRLWNFLIVASPRRSPRPLFLLKFWNTLMIRFVSLLDVFL